MASPEQGSSMSSSASPTSTDAACSPPGSPGCRSSRTFVKSQKAHDPDDCKRWEETTMAGTLSAHSLAVNLRGREEGARPELDDVASLRAASGGSSRSYVLTSSAEGFPARTSASPDDGEDSPANDPASSSSSPSSLTLFDPSGFSSRTSPVSSRLADVRDAHGAERFSAGIAIEAARMLADALNSTSWATSPRWTRVRALDAAPLARSSTRTTARTSPWFAPSCETSGTESPGGFATVVSSECRSDDGGCSSSEPSLTEILVPPESVPARYSLSARAATGILRRAAKRGRSLPPSLRLALEAVATASQPTTPQEAI